MAKSDSQDPLLPSLLDRLIDHDPDVSTEPAWKRAQTVREYELGVLRDIEALLNTRQTRPMDEDDFAEVSKSVLTYGMPDFTTALAGSLDDSERLRRAVENAITYFEPRVREVEVKIIERKNDTERTLRMVVEGMLWIEPEPLPIVFDTVIQPLTGQYTVSAR